MKSIESSVASAKSALESAMKNAKRHHFSLELKQRVVVVTDLGRGGVILKRSTRKYELGTDAYFVKRDSDGKCEWYPEFALTTETKAAVSAPTEVAWYKCARGHLHDSPNAVVDCDVTAGQT